MTLTTMDERILPKLGETATTAQVFETLEHFR
jgi:hypothetical protein